MNTVWQNLWDYDVLEILTSKSQSRRYDFFFICWIPWLTNRITMKKQLVFWTAFLISIQGQDLNTACRKFSYDLCDFDENAILDSWNSVQSSQDCQDRCMENDKCQTFRFNLQ